MKSANAEIAYATLLARWREGAITSEEFRKEANTLDAEYWTRANTAIGKGRWTHDTT